MKNFIDFGSATRLVFCNEDVEPDIVTQILCLQPTFSLKVGEATIDATGREYISQLGIWKLKFPDNIKVFTNEEKIESWINFLSPKTSEMHQLHSLGYRPYLDCPAYKEDLSVYLEPSLMQLLGELKLGLSIWLYKFPV